MVSRYLKKCVYAVFAVGFLLGVYAACIEPFRLVVTEWNVTTPKWTSPKPLKIVLLADMHAIYPSMTKAHMDKIIARTNELKPDIVLLLGDYVATHPFGKQIPPDEGVAAYKDIQATCGTFAILGNHDLRKSKGWPEALIKTGIPVLRNEARAVDCHGSKFWMAGLDEWWFGHPDMTKINTAITDANPVVLMTHNPDAFVEVPDKIALTVAGHTHGGQIRLPFIGAIPFVVPSAYGTRFVYGHIQEQGKDLVVSSGLGMTGLPLRFLCPPEITVVTLKTDKRPSE